MCMDVIDVVEDVLGVRNVPCLERLEKKNNYVKVHDVVLT